MRYRLRTGVAGPGRMSTATWVIWLVYQETIVDGARLCGPRERVAVER